MISGTLGDKVAGTPRVEGYRQALEDHDIQYLNSRVADGDFRWEGGRKAMELLLADAPPFTGLFAASDEMAIGAMGVAFAKGI